MKPGFLLSANYATRSGRKGSRSVIIDRETGAEAVAELVRRLERRGCSKIDITNYGRKHP